MSDISVREISMADTRTLRHAVLRRHETIEDLAAQEPAGAFAVGAFDRATLIGVGFIAPDGDAGSWRIRGMATTHEARGKGVGTAILYALVQHAVGKGASRVWCNARTPALSLYERAGFLPVSAEFELPHIGPHVVMQLDTPAYPSEPR